MEHGKWLGTCKIYFADPRLSQAGFTWSICENSVPGIMALRPKIEYDQISSGQIHENVTNVIAVP